MTGSEAAPSAHETAVWSECPSWPRDWQWVPEPPGATLRELMDETGATVDDFVRDTGLDCDTLNGILDGAVALTPAISGQLSRATGVSAQFWLNMQHLVDDARARDLAAES